MDRNGTTAATHTLVLLYVVDLKDITDKAAISMATGYDGNFGIAQRGSTAAYLTNASDRYKIPFLQREIRDKLNTSA